MRIPSFITPNWLTVTRILFIPVGVYFLFLDGGDNAGNQIIAWTIFFFLGLTDFVDGKWARQSNRITALGWFKFTFISVAIILTLTSAYEYINAWRTSAGKGKVK